MPITLTINGISGKVEDWEQGTIGTTGYNVDSSTRIRSKLFNQVQKGKTYSIACTKGFNILAYKGSSGFTEWGKSLTFVSEGNEIRLAVRKEDDSPITPSEIEQVKPMLNLGTTPIPYEPKRGDRMVEPVAKKNLITGNFDTSKGDKRETVNVKPNTTYTVSSSNSETFTIDHLKSDGTYIKTAHLNKTSPYTFTTESDVGQLKFFFKSSIEWAQLEPGTIATTPYEPYAVQLNPKPKTLVPKKNLIPSFKDSRWNKHANLTVVGDYEAVLDATGAWQSTTIFLPVESNKNYNLIIDTNGDAYSVQVHKGKTTSFSNNGVGLSFTVDGSYGGYITLRFSSGAQSTGQFTFKEPMLVEGSTAQPFEPYQEVLPRAKTGVVMPGNAYVQLPSMTMDSIEIDCLIDSVQSGNAKILDARSGLSNGWVLFDGRCGVGELTGHKYNERTKLIFKTDTPFTDDITIFAHYSGAMEYIKGTIYAIKCYLGNQVVAEYDFSNPSNIVGDKLIPNAKNLIPSFEDEAWNLHSNFKVFGPNVGRLDATGGGQMSIMTIPVKVGETYLLKGMKGQQHAAYVRKESISGEYIGNNMNKDFVFAADNTFNGFVCVYLSNTTTGSFDFIKPQLYELSGKEAQLFGSPTPQLKAPKRILYAKR